MDLLIAVLTPLAALIGSYLGSRFTSAHQLRLERRVETAETILGLPVAKDPRASSVPILSVAGLHRGESDLWKTETVD